MTTTWFFIKSASGSYRAVIDPVSEREGTKLWLRLWLRKSSPPRPWEGGGGGEESWEDRGRKKEKEGKEVAVDERVLTDITHKTNRIFA